MWLSLSRKQSPSCNEARLRAASWRTRAGSLGAPASGRHRLRGVGPGGSCPSSCHRLVAPPARSSVPLLHLGAEHPGHDTVASCFLPSSVHRCDRRLLAPLLCSRSRTLPLSSRLSARAICRTEYAHGVPSNSLPHCPLFLLRLPRPPAVLPVVIAKSHSSLLRVRPQHPLPMPPASNHRSPPVCLARHAAASLQPTQA